MTIFISIASYEDPFLIDTIQSALKNAENPDDLFFGVCSQYKIIEEPDLSFIPEDKIKIIRYDPDTRPGLYKIRAEIASLHANQDYFLQIDSHTWFIKGWDKILIKEYQECQKYAGHDKVILANMFRFSLSYDPKIVRAIGMDFYDKDVDNNDLGLLFLLGDNGGTMKKNYRFLPTPLMQVGTIFCTVDYLTEVGHNEYMQFMSEQQYQSFATFMCGWDAYQPLISPIYHNNKEYKYILKKNNVPLTYQSDKVFSNTLNLMFLNLAFLYNDYSIYKIKNAVRKPIDFWSSLGLEKEYKERLSIVDKILRGESPPSDTLLMETFPQYKRD